MMNSWDMKPQGFYQEKSQWEISNRRTGCGCMHGYPLEAGKYHMWTRMSKNPSCCDIGDSHVLGNLEQQGLLEEENIVLIDLLTGWGRNAIFEKK